MTEQSEEPKPGSFNWLLSNTPSVEHEFQLPLPKPQPGVEQTLRVVITARATVSPNRPWGIFIMVWASIIAGLLLAIALNTAHGAENWQQTETWRHGQDWGEMTPGQTTTYRDVINPDGSTGRCALYRWRGEPRIDCRN